MKVCVCGQERFMHTKFYSLPFRRDCFHSIVWLHDSWFVVTIELLTSLCVVRSVRLVWVVSVIPDTRMQPLYRYCIHVAAFNLTSNRNRSERQQIAKSHCSHSSDKIAVGCTGYGWFVPVQKWECSIRLKFYSLLLPVSGAILDSLSQLNHLITHLYVHHKSENKVADNNFLNL